MVHEKPQEGRSLASRYMNIYDIVCSILLLENKNVYFKGATSANAHWGEGGGWENVRKIVAEGQVVL